jgi:predicted transcriptional regulator
MKNACIQMREAGMQVKDIAAKLGLHRTTVTEYCKVHDNTESA